MSKKLNLLLNTNQISLQLQIKYLDYQKNYTGSHFRRDSPIFNANEITNNELFNEELIFDQNRSPSYQRGRNQAKLIDLCSEDKQKIGQILSKLTQEAEEKKLLYEQLIKTQSGYEEKIEKMRKNSQDIYYESKNLRKEYKDTMQYLEKSSNLVINFHSFLSRIQLYWHSFISNLFQAIQQNLNFKIQLKSRSLKLSQNLGNLDHMQGNEKNKKTFQLINQIKYQNFEQNNIQNNFLKEYDYFQLSQNKPNSFHKHIITEESDFKGNGALKLSDIISSGKFQEGQLLKYSENSNSIQQRISQNNQSEVDKNSLKRMQRNHSVHIQNITDIKSSENIEDIQNQNYSVRQRYFSSKDFQNSYKENTRSTIETQQSQNEQKESAISIKKNEIVQLKDEIKNLAQSLKHQHILKKKGLGKRNRRGTIEGETPSKNKSIAQEDSKFVSPNFKSLITCKEQQIDEELKNNKQSGQNHSNHIQNNSQEQETFYFKDNKIQEEEIRLNKINNNLLSQSNYQQTSSQMNKQPRQSKSCVRDSTVEDSNQEQLQQKRLIEQLQIKQRQLQFEDNYIDQDLYSIEDSELKLSNLRINKSFQSTQRNLLASSSNSKQKEIDERQQKNSCRNKESVKNLIEHLSIEEISQIKQHIEQKLLQNESKKHSKQYQSEVLSIQLNKNDCEKQQKYYSQNPFNNKIKQFMSIKDRIIGENKSLNQQDQLKSSDGIKKNIEASQQKETTQNIKKQLFNEFQVFQNDQILDKFQQQLLNQKQSKSESYNGLVNHSLNKESDYFSCQNKINQNQSYFGSDNFYQNNVNSYIKSHGYQTNPERNLMNYNLERQEKNIVQTQQYKNSQSMNDYQLNILQMNQNQNEEFQNKKISQNNHQIQKQQANFQYDINNLSNDNDTLNGQIRNRSFQYQQKSINSIKNENILDFYHQQQQNHCQQNLQTQQINQIQDYQNFQRDQNKQIDQQNTLKQIQQPYQGVFNYNNSQISSIQHQSTLPKSNQQNINNNANIKKYIDDYNMKENQYKYSNLPQYQIKKNECDELDNEILDLLNDGDYRKKIDKPLLNQMQTSKTPKSIEKQVQQIELTQKPQINNELHRETKELLKRYNRLVGQISEKLKQNEIQNKHQNKQKQKNNKSSYRF